MSARSSSRTVRSRHSAQVFCALALVLVAVQLVGAVRTPAAEEEDAESKLAKETQNPVANLISAWVIGALANQQWDFAGWSNTHVNAMLIQPFVNYNFSHGWYLTTAPIITANWSASGDNHWTVPVGGGGGKLWRVGKVGLPINTQLPAFYNAETPEFGPDWQLRFQVQFLFPR